MLLGKPWKEVDKEDLEAFLQAGVREAGGLDYKQILPLKDKAKVASFVCDVLAMANFGGGHILYGVHEEEGVPTKWPGVKANADSEELRLGQYLRQWTDPPVRHKWHWVAGFDRGPVAILEVPPSWTGPHLMKNEDKYSFWTREGPGNVPMNVRDIRQAFERSGAISERFRAWREERVSVVVNRSPIPLSDHATVIFHICPYESLAGRVEIDPRAWNDEGAQGHLKPFDSTIRETRFNVDGFLAVTGRIGGNKDEPHRGYAQAFRGGQVEQVASLVRFDNGAPYLEAAWVEHGVTRALRLVARAYAHLDVAGPVVASLTIIRAKGVQFRTGEWMDYEPGYVAGFDRDLVLVPEVLIESVPDLDADFHKCAAMLRPLFDMVWQSAGLSHCSHFDEKGILRFPPG